MFFPIMNSKSIYRPYCLIAQDIVNNIMCLNIDNYRHWLDPFAAQKSRETEPPHVEFKELQNQKFQEVDKCDWKNIVDGNEELDNVAKDYDETVAKHLQSIANLTKENDSVDGLRSALLGAKFELTTALRRRVLEDNADDARRLGVHRVEKTANYYLPEDAIESQVWPRPPT